MLNKITATIVVLTGLGMFAGQSATAQITADGTVPTVVGSPDGLNFTISGGGRSSSNLFHSFSQFSVPTGGTASFDNAVDVQNTLRG
jgi:large exoprotein involved in heme utilization and adhesion